MLCLSSQPILENLITIDPSLLGALGHYTEWTRGSVIKEPKSYGNRCLTESQKCVHHRPWQQYNNVEKTTQKLRGKFAPII